MSFSEYIITLNNQVTYLMQDNRCEEAMELINFVYAITGLSINMPRYGIPIEDYCAIIVTHISCLMNVNKLYDVEKDFKKFEGFSRFGKIPLSLAFKFQENKSEYYYRRGFYRQAMSEVNWMEKIASIDDFRFRMLIQKAKIENANRNVFSPFSINCISEALGVAEKMNDPYAIALSYNELAAMFTIHYPSLSFTFAKKAELTYLRNGMIRDAYDQRVPIANALIINFMKDPTHNQNFREDARKELALVDRSKLFQEQHKADYDYVYGMAYDDIDSLQRAAAFYKNMGSYGSYCQVLDRIICLRVDRKEYRQADKEIGAYLEAARKTHEKDYNQVVSYFTSLRNAINEQLGEQKE